MCKTDKKIRNIICFTTQQKCPTEAEKIDDRAKMS